MVSQAITCEVATILMNALRNLTIVLIRGSYKFSRENFIITMLSLSQTLLFVGMFSVLGVANAHLVSMEQVGNRLKG